MRFIAKLGEPVFLTKFIIQKKDNHHTCCINHPEVILKHGKDDDAHLCQWSSIEGMQNLFQFLSPMLQVDSRACHCELKLGGTAS